MNTTTTTTARISQSSKGSGASVASAATVQASNRTPRTDQTESKINNLTESESQELTFQAVWAQLNKAQRTTLALNLGYLARIGGDAQERNDLLGIIHGCLLWYNATADPHGNVTNCYERVQTFMNMLCQLSSPAIREIQKHAERELCPLVGGSILLDRIAIWDKTSVVGGNDPTHSDSGSLSA